MATVKVSYLQAILGGELEFEGLDAKVPVNVPSGTSPGARLRLDGHGLPSLRQRDRRGALFLEDEVEIPRKLDKEEERLLREIAEKKGLKSGAKKRGLFG
jgi:molecular chaperone DnaJ